VCSHSEAPGHSGVSGRLESHKVQKREIKVLHLRRSNPLHLYVLGIEWLESSSGEKDLGILVDLQADQEPEIFSVVAAKKTNPRKNIPHRSGKVVLTLYSALVRHV